MEAIDVVADGLPMLSEKMVTDEDAATIVMETLAEPVPAEFDAEMVTVDVPAALGVPEINPVEVFTLKPAGKPVALKDVGVLLAMIW